MPQIKSSTDLRNGYNAISTLCHETREPVFITKNGRGDLAVMSIDSYEDLIGRLELYHFLEKGEEDVREGRKGSVNHVFADVRREVEHGPL